MGNTAYSKAIYFKQGNLGKNKTFQEVTLRSSTKTMNL